MDHTSPAPIEEDESGPEATKGQADSNPKDSLGAGKAVVLVSSTTLILF
jgi:hypothetical protein